MEKYLIYDAQQEPYQAIKKAKTKEHLPDIQQLKVYTIPEGAFMSRLISLCSNVLLSSFIFLDASEPTAKSCPVIDFGDDLSWYTHGIPSYRRGSTLPDYNINGGPLIENRGEGTFVIGNPWNLDQPLSPQCSDYNERGNNTRFYGGMKTVAYKTTGNKHHWTEGGINVNHDGFDDFNYMGFGLEGNGNTMKAFGVWLWKKEDFINGGDMYPVTFNDDSRLAVFLSRTYAVDDFKDTYAFTKVDVSPRETWRGWEDVHLIVQDGEQFYIAETDYKPKKWTLYDVQPTQVKWALYNPQAPWDFEWDKTTAVYEEHTFTDVQSAGWMIAKPNAEVAGLWLKWYSFGLDAVVNRPEAEQLAWNIQMKPMAEGLHIAKDSVSYADWLKIFQWASRNQYCLHNGYSFKQDGHAGITVLDNNPHSSDEPVTGITWQDAALWCNALSEYEGKTPCYYSDSACTTVLRMVTKRTGIDTINFIPPIYLKTESNGYRLPTGQELEASGISNGTIWQFIWNADNTVFDPTIQTTRTVLAGDKFIIGTQAGGEIPSRGHHSISFRPVCGAAPQFAAATTNLNSWTFAEEERIDGPAVTTPQIELIEEGSLLAGKTEISYAQWKAVYAWAEAKDYRFDHSGDMGSVKWDLNPSTHSQDEPVTTVSLLDTMVWCNALSEMNGLTPVYHVTDALNEPLKIVHPGRVLDLPNRETMYHCKPRLCGILRQLIHVDEQANGYRLPTHAEWSKLAGGGIYPSGKTLDPATAWTKENSGQHTHPVGSNNPTGAGFYDLAGNVFEWVLIHKKARGKQPAFWEGQCRGGSHRSENLTRNAPMKNKFTAFADVGQGIHVGIAKHEIGFRVVRNK